MSSKEPAEIYASQAADWRVLQQHLTIGTDRLAIINILQEVNKKAT